MHKILQKLTKSFTTFPENFNHQIPNVRLFASFVHKDFAYANAGDTGTLRTRLLRHLLVEKTTDRKLINREVRYSDLFPVHREAEFVKKLNEISTDQLARSIVYTSIYKNGCEPAAFAFVINNLDNVCASKLDQMELSGILQIMNAFMYVLPEKLVRLDFYKQGVPRMVELFGDSGNLEDFLKVAFYLGCWKKSQFASDLNEKFMDRNLKRFLRDEELTTTDFAIVCHSTFKTSVKLANNDSLLSRLESEIVNMTEIDDSLLITFIKSARQLQLSSSEITEKLRSLILSETKFHFVGYIHILAYFADNLIADDKVVPILISKCMETIFSAGKPWQSELRAGQSSLANVRGKDISNFLWSCAFLNLKVLNDDQLRQIAQTVSHKIENQEYNYRHNILIDTILSLWMLQHRCQDLVVTMLTDRAFNRPANFEKLKLETRKHLLINAVDIEAPEILRHCNIRRTQSLNESVPAPDYLLKSRKQLKHVYQLLDANQESLGIKSMKYVSQIKHLNIAGILAETDDKRNINVEVLEKGYLLSDNVTPMGIFSLKTRLLKASGCQTITINPIVHQTDVELLKHIEEQLQQVDQKPDDAVTKVRKYQ